MASSSIQSDDSYSSPLTQRYASPEMAYVFSPACKYSTWRKLWIALAQAQKELGLSITDEQILQMKDHVEEIDFRRVAEIEKETRHDVMAHIRAFGEQCPLARPVIHLGATSAFVGDNTDLIQMRRAMRILIQRTASVMKALREFALAHKATPTLGYTHFQPAQPVTVGKRACLWLFDLSIDLDALVSAYDTMPMRGAKGTTGTQASYLALFNGNGEAVKRLDRRIAEAMGFSSVLPVTGQTYTRKIDAAVLSILAGMAQSLHKLANDVRLLQHCREIEEPFAASQVGSSAMAYKRNPMRCERLTALCRFIISLSSSPVMTAAEQWLERTLDDSANKRLVVPEAFLAADAACIIARDVCAGLTVNQKTIERRLSEELPFMATENILMAAVKRGGDRQSLHERIRGHAVEAARAINREGTPNDLLQRLAADPELGLSRSAIEGICRGTSFIGRAPEQVTEYIREHIAPRLEKADGFGTVPERELTI